MSVSITSTSNGVAVITINNPPVNALHPNIQIGLDKAYKEACNNPTIKAVVITGAGRMFVAGADIGHLQTLPNVSAKEIETDSRKGNAIFNSIESGRLPSVAAVNGDALGGGCELALACNARVATDKATFGLPELSLGIIPGLGGTQRLPRVIGVERAVTITMTGKKLKSKEALAAGLISKVVKDNELIEEASKLALSIAAGKTPRMQSLQRNDRLKSYEECKGILEMARSQAYAKNKNLPQPFAYLDVVEIGLKQGGDAGLDAEIKAFCKLVQQPVARSLIHFFFASRATVKIPGLPEKPAGKSVKNIAVIGGGTMGAGICIAFLAKGYNVILKEINASALEAGVGRIVSQMERVIKSRKLPMHALEMMMRPFKGQIDYSGFDQVDLVIEAALERIDLKQKLFVELESKTPKHCILATNTSTIDLDVIAANLPESAKSRIIGLHFFSPAHIMPLLEIIRTKNTSPDVVALCVKLSKVIGKTPVVVGNTVGFGANRGMFPYGQGAGLLVDMGVHPYKIDSALESFGMPIGVFKMNDLSGIDIGIHVSQSIASAYGDRSYFSSGGQQLFEKKRLGQKSGGGWYDYDSKSKPKPNKTIVDAVVAKAQEDAKQNGSKLPQLNSLDNESIVEMIYFPVINEFLRIRAEGHVLSDGDVDVLSVMGYGFPAWRGGVMFWAVDGLKEKGGLAYVKKRLEQFEKQVRESGNGPANQKAAAFFKPCRELENRATRSIKSNM